MPESNFDLPYSIKRYLLFLILKCKNKDQFFGKSKSENPFKMRMRILIFFPAFKR